jgi:hypothetical protein
LAGLWALSRRERPGGFVDFPFAFPATMAGPEAFEIGPSARVRDHAKLKFTLDRLTLDWRGFAGEVSRLLLASVRLGGGALLAGVR